MKRKTALFCLLLLLVGSIAIAAEMADVVEHGSCKYCGMYRDKFAHSRMLISYDDGTSVGTCSIRCAAVDLANNIDKAPVSIQVGDFSSKRLLDAEEAAWVLGGKVPGVMTSRPKWAFSGQGDAEAFIRENGGDLVDFERAMAAAYEDLYRETKMIRDKRKMMRMQQEKK